MTHRTITVRTITVAAWRRPGYLARVLDSLIEALGACSSYMPDKILIGIDGADTPEDAQRRSEVIHTALGFRVVNTEFICWPERLGVDEHPRRLLQEAFVECGSEVRS